MSKKQKTFFPSKADFVSCFSNIRFMYAKMPLMLNKPPLFVLYYSLSSSWFGGKKKKKKPKNKWKESEFPMSKHNTILPNWPIILKIKKLRQRFTICLCFHCIRKHRIFLLLCKYFHFFTILYIILAMRCDAVLRNDCNVRWSGGWK